MNPLRPPRHRLGTPSRHPLCLGARADGQGLVGVAVCHLAHDPPPRPLSPQGGAAGASRRPAPLPLHGGEGRGPAGGGSAWPVPRALGPPQLPRGCGSEAAAHSSGHARAGHQSRRLAPLAREDPLLPLALQPDVLALRVHLELLGGRYGIHDDRHVSRHRLNAPEVRKRCNLHPALLIHQPTAQVNIFDHVLRPKVVLDL
mmetsp:Transcript_46033/g.144349  ORF Transcript_46033/g.144349 Transcript_46033/m.144349 type:complete len:201 (-) Transcript_46033:300-902(-)